MLKKSILMILLLVLAGCKKDDSIQDDYISQIEQEYQQSGTDNVIIESDTTDSNNSYSPSGNNFYGDSNYGSSSSTTTNSYGSANSYTGNSYTGNSYDTTTSKPTYSSKPKPTKITVNNFYSPWTSKNDPKIIKEIRVMIANREYNKAKTYIDNLDLANLPADVDLGQVYQFKGIVYYFLTKANKSNITIADEAFKNVMNNTKIEKFKPLSLLWNGMLYQTYSTNNTELENAVALFDRVINEYPRTRFANDATFYKAVTLKKLGKPESEYKDLFLSIKRGGFADTLIYSQRVNDYVEANSLVNKQIN